MESWTLGWCEFEEEKMLHFQCSAKLFWTPIPKCLFVAFSLVAGPQKILTVTGTLLLRRGRKITMNSYQKWFSYQATRFKDKGFQCAAPVFNSGRIPGRTGLDEWDTVETGAARRILFSPVHTSDERFPVVFLVILDPLVGFSTQTSLHWSKQFIFYVQYNERNIQFR